MTREHKLALVVGFSLVLVVGVLISDHFSKARNAKIVALQDKDPVVTPATLVRSEPAPPSMPPPTTLAGPDRQPDASLPKDWPDSGAPNVIDMGKDARNSTIVSDFDSRPTVLGPGSLQPMVVPSDPGRPLGSSGVEDFPDSFSDPAHDPKPRPGSPALPTSKGTLQRYEVVKGDNIGRIADKYYGDRNLWKALQSYNKSKVSADGIMRSGITLLIPPRDVLLGQAALPADTRAGAQPPAAGGFKDAAPPKPDAAKAKAAGPTLYTVQSGDTLSKIAERKLGSKAKWELIRDLNADTLEDDDTLTTGQQLKLPSK